MYKMLKRNQILSHDLKKKHFNSPDDRQLHATILTGLLIFFNNHLHGFVVPSFNISHLSALFFSSSLSCTSKHY